MRYELTWSYPPNVAAGEDIRITSVFDGLPVRDFWLFDSRTLLWLDYDAAGHLVSAELVEDPAVIVRANSWRDVALHAGVALEDYAKKKLAA